ncbi:hypothetical protein GXW82_44220 [Streptacidiphilus sp. 4-A2]|nr:hypothetical protein [Streptacidiphilus sp. 4-A2]
MAPGCPGRQRHHRAALPRRRAHRHAVSGTITYNGESYAYLGAGTDDGSWPNHPNDVSGHLNGALADFAAYDYALDPASIASQYTTVSSPTVAGSIGTDAASAYRDQIVQADPIGYWRLDDPDRAAAARPPTSWGHPCPTRTRGPTATSP